MIIGRKSLPHECPLGIDPAQSVWFMTLCCAQRGRDQLTLPGVSAALLESVRFRQESGLWYVHLFLLMPDHCHALISFPPEQKIAQTMRDWKRWTARNLGVVWQRDFFDHRLRQDESYRDKYDYIMANPVRAGLVASAEEWPHLWESNGRFGKTSLPE